MHADLPIFDFTPGTSPLLISVPHAGTWIPDPLAEKLVPGARALPDTDWLVDELYGFATGIGAGMIRANCSRYLVDLNRPPDDSNLYNSKTTGLFPLIDFSGTAVYLEGHEPTGAERAERLNRYWKPYHYQLQVELNRLQMEYGYAVLLDAHSIAAQVPMLFEGTLPDFNLGSNDGESANHDLVSMAYSCLADNAGGYTAVLNGRFKGGYITRHYGKPAENVHALQLELSQATYLQSGPQFQIDQKNYTSLQPVLESLVYSLMTWKPDD